MLLSALALIFVFGAGIGATGIGGVGVVPVLIGLSVLPVSGAVPVAQAAFAVTSCVGAVMHRRSLAGLDRKVVALLVWAAAGAVAGALLLPVVAGLWLEVALGLLMIGAGVFELVRALRPGLGQAAASREPDMRLVGSGVGVGSALTGTGGPILFVPTMLLAGVELRRIVALAQLIQAPIAGAATAVHLARGALDLPLAGIVGTALGLGVIAGAMASRRMSVERLRLVLGVALVAGGAAFLATRS